MRTHPNNALLSLRSSLIYILHFSPCTDSGHIHMCRVARASSSDASCRFESAASWLVSHHQVRGDGHRSSCRSRRLASPHLSSSVCLSRACERARRPRGRTEEGPASGLAAQQAREKDTVGNQAKLTVSTETLSSGEMQTSRATGSRGVTKQMGKQQEVTLWTGRARAPYQKEGPSASSPSNTHLQTNTHCVTQITCDT